MKMQSPLLDFIPDFGKDRPSLAGRVMLEHAVAPGVEVQGTKYGSLWLVWV